MKKKYGVAVAIVALAAILTAGCGAEKVESTASIAESTTAVISSASGSAASDAIPEGESMISEDEKKLANFKTEDFKVDNDIMAQAEAAARMLAERHEKLTAADGTCQVNVTLSGGSGRAKIASPTELMVKDGRTTAEIAWSSDKYSYTGVEGIRFTSEIQSGHSVFMVSVTELDKPLTMVGNTTAMGTPHTISCQLTFELQE